MNGILATLRWLTPIAVYTLLAIFTLLVLLVIVSLLLEKGRYRGHRWVAIGRSAWLLCALAVLWLMAGAFKVVVSAGIWGLFPVMEYLTNADWWFPVFAAYTGLAVLALVGLYLGAFLAPRHIRTAILNFDL